MSVDNSLPAANELPEGPNGLRDVVADLVEEVSQLRAENEHLRERVDELEEEVAEQESIEYRGDTKDIESLSVGGIPVGKSIASNKQGRKNLSRFVFGNPDPDVGKSDIESVVEDHGTVEDTVTNTQSTAEDQSEPAQHRENMLPLHRMMVDLHSGAGASLSKSQKRAAALYERFVNKAKGETNQNVTPDGQKFAMNTEQAVEVLEDEGLLDGVKPQSYSKTAGRVMRDVQRFTIVDGDAHKDCVDIDKCSDHGVINFRPGKPHTLTVAKQNMKASVHNADTPDTGVRTDDEGENEQDTAEEESSTAKFDQLNQATAVNADD